MEHYIKDLTGKHELNIKVVQGEVHLSVFTQNQDSSIDFKLSLEDLEVIDFMRKPKHRKSKDND